MDPDQALYNLVDCFCTGDMDNALDFFDGLQNWIAKGGFLPKNPYKREEEGKRCDTCAAQDDASHDCRHCREESKWKPRDPAPPVEGGRRCPLDHDGCTHHDKPQDMPCNQQNCPWETMRNDDAWWEGHPGKYRRPTIEEPAHRCQHCRDPLDVRKVECFACHREFCPDCFAVHHCEEDL